MVFSCTLALNLKCTHSLLILHGCTDGLQRVAFHAHTLLILCAISDAPYTLDKAWVDSLVEKHNIDYVVHGDDPCIGVRPVQGHDVSYIMATFSWIPLRTRTHAPTHSSSRSVASCPWVC